MPQFGCRCGNSISQVIIPLRDGGRILRDGEEWHISEEAVHSVATYVDAIRIGEQERFIEQKYSGPPYPSDAEVIVGLINAPLWKRSLEIFQCDYCGRVWIENSLSPGKFRSFKPDAEWRGIFEVFPPGFLSYEAEASFYACRLEDIKRQEDTATITFKNWEGQQIGVRFTGVVSIEKKIVENPDRIFQGLQVKSLSKWEAEPPCYKYIFADYFNFEEDESDYLAIVAQRFEVIEVAGGELSKDD